MRFAKNQFSWDPANQDNVERAPNYAEGLAEARDGEEGGEEEEEPGEGTLALQKVKEQEEGAL